MPNLITRYDSGTFEAAQGGWNQELGALGSYTIIDQNAVEFHSGAKSCRIQTALTPSFSKGHRLPIKFSFLAVDGESYECKLWVKASASMPDDVIFLLLPNYKIGNSGILTSVRAADCKDGWFELSVNFVASTYPQAGDQLSNVTLAIINGSDQFNITYPEFKNDFPDSLDFFANINLASFDLFVDDASSEQKAIPVPAPPADRSNLYHIENIFLLRVGSKIYTINEPIKWSDVQVSVEFDEAARAFKFEFTDKDVLLEFDTAAGFLLLMEELKKNGVEGDASLKFGEVSQDGVVTILYEGNINFESKIVGKYSVKFNCEKRSLGEKFRTYYDTKTNIFATHSLGGNPMTPLSTTKLFLHPRQLTYQANFNYNYNTALTGVATYSNITTYSLGQRVKSKTGKVYESLQNLNTGHDPITSPTWWKLSINFPWTLDADTTDPFFKLAVPPYKALSNNVDGLLEPNQPDGQLLYTGLTLPGNLTKRSFFIEFHGRFFVNTADSGVFPQIGIAVYKRSNISGGVFTTHPTIPVGDTNNRDVIGTSIQTGNVEHTNEFGFVMNGIIDLFADEALFIQAFVYTDTTADSFFWENFSDFYLNIRERTVYDASAIDALRLHETINRQIETTTDRTNILKSNFIGRTDLGYAQNGCASNQYVMNGAMIRKLLSSNFIMSSKDWFSAINALYCMGMSIERNNTGGEFIRFEPIEFFFKNVLLMRLDSISDYEKTSESKLLFNEIEVAASKYPQDNQQDSLEDFMTKMNYTTALTKIKNKLTIALTWILSPYYIEYTRRQSFEINPSNSYETDADTFLISGTSPTDQLASEISVEWNSVDSTATVAGIVSAIVGDILTFSGGGTNDGDYTIIDVDFPLSFDSTVLTLSAAVVDATTVSSISSSEVRASAKRNEDFAVVDGVTFPNSVYNLEHNFKRIVLRWAKYFQSGWFMFVGLNTGKGIKFNTGINNTNVGTQFKDSYTCSLGESKKLLRYDRGSESTENMNKPLFTDSYIKFSSRISWAQFNYLTKAFEGRNPDGKDYGFVQITNPQGEIENGFVQSMKFVPSKEICKFTLMEKFNG